MVKSIVAGDTSSTKSPDDNAIDVISTLDIKQTNEENATKLDPVQKEVQEMLESDLTCPICADIYINPLILNCSHSFCKFCVYQWLSEKTGCPQCRLDVSFQAENRALRDIINRMIPKTSQQFQMSRSNNVAQRLQEEERLETNGTHNLMPWVKIDNVSTYNFRPRTVRYRLARADPRLRAPQPRPMAFDDAYSRWLSRTRAIRNSSNDDSDSSVDIDVIRSIIRVNNMDEVYEDRDDSDDDDEDDEDNNTSEDGNNQEEEEGELSRHSPERTLVRRWVGSWNNVSMENPVESDDEDWIADDEEEGGSDSNVSDSSLEIDVLDDDVDTDMELSPDSSDDDSSSDVSNDEDDSDALEVDDEDENPVYYSSTTDDSSSASSESDNQLDGTINISVDSDMLDSDSSNDPDYDEEPDRYGYLDATIVYATSEESDY